MSNCGVLAVVVAYRGRGMVADCVRALIASRYRDLNILVVDNGSGDGTLEAAKVLGVEVLALGENRGFAGGVNAGMEYWEREHGAECIYALVNQDCVVDPGWLGPFVVALLADTRVDVVGGRLYSSHDRVLQHAGATVAANGLTAHIGRGASDDSSFRDCTEVDYVTGALCAFRREAWEEHGPFDEGYFPAYFEEVDFCTRCRDSGGTILYIPESEASHFEGSVLGVATPEYLRAYHRGRMRYVVKHLFARGRASATLRSELSWLAGLRRMNEILPALSAYRLIPRLVFEKRFAGSAKRIS